MSALKMSKGGGWVSIQDLGRPGLQRFGVSEAGAADPVAFRIANRLVGNADDVPAVEIGLLGAEFSIESASLTVAVAGPDALWQIDGEPCPANRSRAVESGSTVRIRPGPSAVYAYLAVPGGFDIPSAFGSVSFHARSGLGGLGGRPLQIDDRLPVRPAVRPDRELGSRWPQVGTTPGVRILAGPQLENFTADGLARLCEQPYRIGAKSDRMGIRLEGAAIPHSDAGYNIVSDGIALGSIQVPGNGQPIVLGPDRQTTGGYPKIAVIVRADMHRFLQTPPGQPVRFTPVDRCAAVAGLRDLRAALDGLTIQPAVPVLSSSRLLSLNLIDGVFG